MADSAKQVRGLLTSGRARVDGRATIDGRDTIKIVFTRVETYYVAADGTYAPVELISGRPTDKNGMTTVFQAYEELPGSSHGNLLSLTAPSPIRSGRLQPRRLPRREHPSVPRRLAVATHR
jgi:hypothetical protein